MAIKIEKALAPNDDILFMSYPMAACGVVVAQGETVADKDGRKIIKAGTPLKGDLTKRTTAFTIPEDSDGMEISGVLEHSVDVTDGNANGSLLLFGFVDLDKVDATVASEKLTENATKALAGRITFLK